MGTPRRLWKPGQDTSEHGFLWLQGNGLLQEVSPEQPHIPASLLSRGWDVEHWPHWGHELPDKEVSLPDGGQIIGVSNQVRSNREDQTIPSPCEMVGWGRGFMEVADKTSPQEAPLLREWHSCRVQTHWVLDLTACRVGQESQEWLCGVTLAQSPLHPIAQVKGMIPKSQLLEPVAMGQLSSISAGLGTAGWMSTNKSPRCGGWS